MPAEALNVDSIRLSDRIVAQPACPPEHMQWQLDILGREIVPRYHKARVAS